MDKTLKLLKGVLISIAIFITLTMIMGVLLKFTAMPEKQSGAYLIVALSLACAFMGLYTGNLFGTRGLIVGFVFSAVLLAVILVMAALCYSAAISAEMFSPAYIIPLICGTFTGIIGANLKN